LPPARRPLSGIAHVAAPIAIEAPPRPRKAEFPLRSNTVRKMRSLLRFKEEAFVLRLACPLKDKRLFGRIRTRILWAWVLALVVCLPALGAVYQWKDAAGTLHFSDTPPPDRPFHLLGEDPSGKAASAPPPATRKRRVQSDVFPHAKGVFWKIEKPGALPSFLLGTIHVEDARVLALPPKVKTAFETADALVLELVLNEATVFKAAASMIYTDGTDLENVLGRSLFERAAAAMAAYGVPRIAVRRMKPWAVMATLMVPKPRTGNFLDITLYRQAVQSGKMVFGLETVEEQIGALESLSMEDQIEILRQTLDQLEALPRMYGAMVETYLSGDLAGLVALSERFVRSQNRDLVQRFMERLNDARNVRMAKRLLPRLEQGNVFAAVGALHLPGEKGLLHLLEKAGYTVTPAS